MLRVLLRDSEAARALFENVGLFKSPELLEKYVIASEVTVEVLDLFLSRVFGTERGVIGNGSGDLKALLEALGSVSLSDEKSHASEELSAPASEPEELHVKVQGLERQLCAIQRQIQMQGEVSQLAMSLDDRLNVITGECERMVSAVSEDVVLLKKEMLGRASSAEMRELSEAVSHLKENEERLANRVSDFEKKVTEAEMVMRDEIQRDVKRLDQAMKDMMDPMNSILGREFVCDQLQPLNGIIAKLTRVCHGNVHAKGVVEVTVSSECTHSQSKPENVVELGTDSWFASMKNPNSWICYDFKDLRVAPTGYTIRADECAFPRSWVLEVSNNGREGTWKVVDRRDCNGDLQGAYAVCYFAISARPSECFRFIRLRQTGKNYRGDDCLFLSSLEIFGTLSSQ